MVPRNLSIHYKSAHLFCLAFFSNLKRVWLHVCHFLLTERYTKYAVIWS